MDKYLTLFTEQLDAKFNPETIFPEKKSKTREWLKRNFTIRKYGKKSHDKKTTVNRGGELEYV